MKPTNLPDLSFVQFCQQEYGINRGVYNTIDLWLFENGLTDIVTRREEILSFLKYTQQQMHSLNDSKKIRFGTKGLSYRLNQFLDG